MYGTRTPPARLEALAREVAGPFTPALAAAGQAVILARRPGSGWSAWPGRTSSGQRLPRTRCCASFTQYWLGRGAPGSPGR